MLLRSRAFVGAGVVGVALVGCTLLVDTADLSEAETLDGDAAAPDAPVPDASEVPDVTPSPPDSGADVAKPSRCTTATSICDDFDLGDLGASWSEVRSSDLSLALDADASVSSPRSLLAVAGTGAGVGLFKRWSVNAARATLAYDMRVDSGPSGGGDYLDAAYLRFTSPAFDRFDLFVDVTGTEIRAGLSYNAKGVLQSVESDRRVGRPAIGKWFHVEVTTDFATLVITLDGFPIVNLTLPAISPTTAEVGLAAHSRTTSWSVRYDNVVGVIEPK